jgi:hypothetical protein
MAYFIKFSSEEDVGEIPFHIRATVVDDIVVG